MAAVPAHGFTLFDTAIGSCAIAWSARGIAGLQLPEKNARTALARLQHRFPDARALPPPRDVKRAIDRVSALLAGRAADLSDITLDLDEVPPFHRRVYEVARAIPAGATLSYGEVATRLGVPGAARAVGQALGRNPFAIVVPCHRVLAAGGRIGGFSADGGIVTKRRLLAIEGARAVNGPALFRGAGLLPFDPETAVAHIRDADPVMARLIDRVGPFALRPERRRSLFAALAESIVYQQLTGRAAATIFARLCARAPCPPGGLSPEHILDASDEELRAVGLSRPKQLSLRDLARRTAAGELPSLREVARMDDETIVERLTPVRGIGRWTVEMLLIFRLGRPDVLPLDDYGVRKGFAAAFRTRDLPARQRLERHGARWSPYRTVASWYLWRAAES